MVTVVRVFVSGQICMLPAGGAGRIKWRWVTGDEWSPDTPESVSDECPLSGACFDSSLSRVLTSPIGSWPTLAIDIIRSATLYGSQSVLIPPDPGSYSLHVPLVASRPPGNTSVTLVDRIHLTMSVVYQVM